MLSAVSEVASVCIMFGYVWGREVAACCPNQSAFPGHQISYRRTFDSIYQHCMERGMFAFMAAERGRQRAFRTPGLGNAFLNDIADLPVTGTWNSAAA